MRFYRIHKITYLIMSSWQKSQYSNKRYFKDDIVNNNVIKTTQNHSINNSIIKNSQTNLISNIKYVISYTKIKELVESYNFKFVTFEKQPIPNAMGIGDLLWNILHLQNKVWTSPVYINVFYFGFENYYPNPENALLFRLDLLNDILSKHRFLTKKNVVFYLNKDLNEQYNTQFLYNKLVSFKINSSLSFPKYLDEDYVIFHTKLRLTSNHKSTDYNLIKTQVKDLCSNLKCKYKIIILGEKIMPLTAESSKIGITTIYNELLSLLDNNSKVIDLSEDNIYNNLDYNKFKRDIGIIKNAKHNIHFGLGGQFTFSLIFSDNVVHYFDQLHSNRDIQKLALNKNLKNYNGFDDFTKFNKYIIDNLDTNISNIENSNIENSNELVENNILVESNKQVNSDNHISYISGGRLGDFIFQLGIIKAKYEETGKKGVLYLADIGDKFVKGLENAYNDTKEFVLKQEYIEDYKIHNGEEYDINLSSWRDVVFEKKRNWFELFKTKYNATFGANKWIDNIPINTEFTDKILISYSLQRENTQINLKNLLDKYEKSKLHFICLDENEYIQFNEKTKLSLPFTHFTNVVDLMIAINSCELFIGNFSAPLCIALAQYKTCIGIPPTDNKHAIDLVLIKDVEKIWKHFTMLL